MSTLTQEATNKYWQYALWLALFTIFYNLAEGLVSIYFGVQDEALTLFGFGIDSFIEVLSGVGILVMVTRIRRNPGTPRSQFERTALRITGTSFYLLSAGLGFLKPGQDPVHGSRREPAADDRGAQFQVVPILA